MKNQYVTPVVRRLAEQHGVDVGAIAGTGAGGRVCKADVLAAASVPGRVAAARSSGRISAAQATDMQRRTRRSPRSVAASLDELTVQDAAWFGDLYAPAPGRSSTRAPSAAAQLPPMTASGVDPKVLLSVPACVRPTLAAASTTQEAFALLADYRGMSDADAEAAIAMDSRAPSPWFDEPSSIDGFDWMDDGELEPRTWSDHDGEARTAAREQAEVAARAASGSGDRVNGELDTPERRARVAREQQDSAGGWFGQG